MSGYVSNYMLGAPISSVVSKDKGDFSNRMNCAGAQIKNNVSTLAQDVVVIGGAAAGTAVATKNAKLTTKIAKGFDKIVKRLAHGCNRFKFSKNVTNINTGWVRKNLARLSPKAKVAIAFALPALAAVGFITQKHIYKMGQIDQKYTDKAALEKHQKEIIK